MIFPLLLSTLLAFMNTYTASEQALLSALASPTSTPAAISSCVAALCSSPPSSPAYKNPALDGKLDGRWELIYQSSPGTSSPVQRLLTAPLRRSKAAYDSESTTKIYQDVDLTMR